MLNKKFTNKILQQIPCEDIFNGDGKHARKSFKTIFF